MPTTPKPSAASPPLDPPASGSESHVGEVKALSRPRPHPCFGCNYDLSATPADANCPECGLSAEARRSPALLAYLYHVGIGAWLVALGSAVGLGVVLRGFLPHTFLEWIDGYGWADRIVFRRTIAWGWIEFAAETCVLVGAWWFLVRPPAAVTSRFAGRGLMPEAVRRVARALVVPLIAYLAVTTTLSTWFWVAIREGGGWPATWRDSNTGMMVDQIGYWAAWLTRLMTLLTVGILALRLMRRLGDERLRRWVFITIVSIPVISFVLPQTFASLIFYLSLNIPWFVFAIPALLTEAAIAALAFCLHRRLKAASATPSPRPTPVVE